MRTPPLPCLLLSVLSACGPGSGPALLPVTLPDLSDMHPAVQSQLRGAEEALTAGGRAERAAAYGALGMLLMAGDYLETAEPSLRNARRLAPEEFRWTYYLAQLRWKQGDLSAAALAFEEARRLRADDFPSLIWLASTYLNLGAARRGPARAGARAIGTAGRRRGALPRGPGRGGRRGPRARGGTLRCCAAPGAGRRRGALSAGHVASGAGQHRAGRAPSAARRPRRRGRRRGHGQPGAGGPADGRSLHRPAQPAGPPRARHRGRRQGGLRRGRQAVPAGARTRTVGFRSCT